MERKQSELTVITKAKDLCSYVMTVTYFYGHFLSSIATPPNSIFRFKRVLTGTAIIF